MRCPNCNKFVSLEFQEPELQDISVSRDIISASVRIVRCCAECGEELKEAILDITYDLPDGFTECFDNHKITVTDTSIEEIEESGGRYQKSYYGACISFEVKCSCGANLEDTMEGKIAASEMGELV